MRFHVFFSHNDSSGNHGKLLKVDDRLAKLLLIFWPTVVPELRPNSSTCQVAGCCFLDKMLDDIRDVSARVCKIAFTNKCNFEGHIEWKINVLTAVTGMYKWRRDEGLEYTVISQLLRSQLRILRTLLPGMRCGKGAPFQVSPRSTAAQTSCWTLQCEAFIESALTKWLVHYQECTLYWLSQYNVAHTKLYNNWGNGQVNH